MKVVPFPGSLVKSIVPSCNCTIRNVIASPIPLPPCLVVKYSRKIFSRSSGGIPAPVSRMRISAVSSDAPRFKPQFAAVRHRLHGVHHHVEHRLLEQVAIHPHLDAFGLAASPPCWIFAASACGRASSTISANHFAAAEPRDSSVPPGA